MAPYLEPTTQAFIDAGAKAGGPKIYELSFTDARGALDSLQNHEPATDVVTEEWEVPTPEGDIKVILYKPAAVKQGDKLKVAAYFHGGGWILGNPNTHDRLLRDLVRSSGMAYYFPYYTPAPDKQYPAQFEQSYAAVEWLSKHGEEKGLDVKKIAVVGDSVGGNMAIAIASLSADRNGPQIAFMGLFYPVTNIASESSTYKTYEFGPGLEAQTLRWMIEAFAPNVADRKNYLLSPLLATTEQLRRLPPAVIITAGVDPLRGEGEEFARKLEDAGGKAALFNADGVVHDFAMLNAFADVPVAKATIELVAWKVKQALA